MGLKELVVTYEGRVKSFTLKQQIAIAEDLLYLQGIDLPVKDEKSHMYGEFGVERFVTVSSKGDYSRPNRVFDYQVSDMVGIDIVAEAKYTSLQIRELREKDELLKSTQPKEQTQSREFP